MENKNVHINLEKSQISGKINKSVFRNLKSQKCGKKKGVVVNSGKSTENIGEYDTVWQLYQHEF